MPALIACVGCRAQVPAIDGPTHRYIGASPGCWAIYGEVLARAPLEPPAGDPASGLRLVVDAYAAQHPGVESLQSVRSVATHLIALHLVLERGLAPGEITRAIAPHLKDPRFRWLEPPGDPGPLTVLDVRAPAARASQAERARAWAASVWDTWSSHHATVRSWAANRP